MNAVVTAEHRATSEIDLGDLNLARMHSFGLETNELKLGKTSCLDSVWTHPSSQRFRTTPEQGMAGEPKNLTTLEAAYSNLAPQAVLLGHPAATAQTISSLTTLGGTTEHANDFMEHANKMLITFYGTPSIAKGLLMSACTC